MGVKITRDEHRNLTLHDVTGPVSEEEMYDALENFYKREPTALLLWDMSQADVSHVTADILKRFVSKSVELEMRCQGGRRIAVVASKDVQYGLARMSEVFAELESAPYSISVFRSHKEALEWLYSGEIG